jgi:hydrogenase expression/formation protein HypE
MTHFPAGKLPPHVLSKLLGQHAPSDPSVILGPGIGLDCAVIEFGDRALVLKSDPITFTAENIGWYAVHVNANDIATTGAQPKWFLATLLLPEDRFDETQIAEILDQIDAACQSIGATLVGGHTEITAGIDRCIVIGTMVGEVDRDSLITPQGARPGDVLLLTKGIPIEATSILANDFADELGSLPDNLLNRAREFLHDPGISVVAEALAAASTGGVTAMHDPTEGGFSAGVWELAAAAKVGIEVEKGSILIPPEALSICNELNVNPLEAIASGALLLTVQPDMADDVLGAIEAIGAAAFVIGRVVEGEGVAMRIGNTLTALPWPTRDALTRLFE